MRFKELQIQAVLRPSPLRERGTFDPIYPKGKLLVTTV